MNRKVTEVPVITQQDIINALDENRKPGDVRRVVHMNKTEYMMCLPRIYIENGQEMFCGYEVNKYFKD